MTSRAQPRNIYIVGAQCTGKTTLVKALEEYFHASETPTNHDQSSVLPPRIITEVARGVLQKHGFTANDITSSPARALALQQHILQAQLDAERCASAHDQWFISDRSGADPIVYARKYVGEEATSSLINSPAWSELGKRMKSSLVVVCEAGADWLMDDGVRLMPQNMDEWVAFHRIFCNSLDGWGITYEVLPFKIGSTAERIAFVVGKWESDNKI